jgi:hypothetical protein
MGLDAVMEPVGPLPPGIYWRRRVVIIVGLIVVLLVARSCAGGGSGKKKGPASISAGGPSTKASTSPPPSPAAVSTPNTATPCVDTQLSLAVTSDGTRYPSGSPAKLTMTVTNNGATACTKDVSASQFGFIISSGGVPTWSSTDCQAATPQIVTLKPKEVRTTAVPWNRHWSDSGCTQATTARLAAPGTYTVKGILGSTLAKDGPVIVLAS